MSYGEYTGARRLYRDRENGWFFGVCAGLANFFDFQTGAIRIAAVVSLLLFFWPTMLVYVTAGFLLRDRPLAYRGRRDERGFWRSRHADHRRHGSGCRDWHRECR